MAITISFITEGEKLIPTSKPVIASGDRDTVTISVAFDSTWDGYAKSGVFMKKCDKDHNVYEAIMDSNNSCIIPHEALDEAGTTYIGIRGVNGASVYTSSLVAYRIDPGAPEGTTATVPPTASVYQQLLTANAVLSSRVDEIASLPEGGTSGDAELRDIRVKADGSTATTAGNAVREQISSLSESIMEFSKLPYYGNYYNERTALLNSDINSSTGALIIGGQPYKVSDKIVMDFSKILHITNSTYTNCYCYGDNDVYYGRIDVNNTSDTIHDRFPNTKYFRIGARMTDDDIMVTYDTANGIPYEEYKPIGGTIEDENDPKVIRVLQYNVGAFTGIEPDGQHTITTALGYRKIIADICPNIACYQSDKWSFSGEDPKDYVFAINPYRVEENGGDYNQHYIASDYEIGKHERIYYSNPSTIQTHKLYSDAMVKVNGKAIIIINIHFDWKDKNDRAKQITRVLATASYFDNVIICGDFNPADCVNGVKQSDNLLWSSELARFESEGFTCANGTGYFGNINTFADPTEIPGAWDNILVKGCLKIKNAKRYEADWLDDHYPFYADIIVE